MSFEDVNQFANVVGFEVRCDGLHGGVVIDEEFVVCTSRQNRDISCHCQELNRPAADDQNTVRKVVIYCLK